MPEEARPDSLSDAEARRRRTVDAAGESAYYEDESVWDVNGKRLGHVTKCFIEDGRLDRCQVTIDGTLQRELALDRDVATFDASWVTDVRDDGLHLAKAAQQVLEAVGAQPGERDTHAEGSSTFPRKER